MSERSSSASGGIGFAGLLTIVFIVLRLWPSPTAANPGAHVINWSWWWVLSPIWISWAVALAIIAVVAVVVVIAALIKD